MNKPQYQGPNSLNLSLYYSCRISWEKLYYKLPWAVAGGSFGIINFSRLKMRAP